MKINSYEKQTYDEGIAEQQRRLDGSVDLNNW